MGGKTSTSANQVTIPPEVMANYQSANYAAQKAATAPFQQYGGEFVAPVNSQQQQGISGVNAAANQAQPYFGAATGQLGQAQAGVNPVNQAATGLAASSAQSVDPSNLDASAINKYMSPYLSTVLGSESALLNQNNQQAQAGQLGTAISSGAFGGDRTGIAAANLNQQQNLANANIYGNILNTGYNNALQTAQQQQGVGLAAGQANRQARAAAGQELAGIGQTAYGEGANTATTLAGLGSGAQTAGLQGAQAQIGAGTVQQQTQQAADTALYNQFLQQQSYPFQTAQFLANVAEGTGALSGSTTTGTQPGGFFSDERLKEDMEPIGKTFDGQPIYRYKMKGDHREQIGLSAQDVEKKHPHAVGVAGGYRWVDYGKATEDAANRGHFFEGGGVAGRVPRRMYAVGGGPSIVDPSDLSALLQAQREMYAPMSGGAGVYGSTASMPHGGLAHVPPPSGATPHLVTAQGGLRPQPTPVENAKNIAELANTGTKLYSAFKGKHPAQTADQGHPKPTPAATPGDAAPSTAGLAGGERMEKAPDMEGDGDVGLAARGGRQGLAAGGNPEDPNASNEPTPPPTELGIPNDAPNTSMMKAPQGGSTTSSGGQSTLQTIGEVAAIAAMFLNRGGRAGKAGGGGLYIPDDPSNRQLTVAEGGLPKQASGLDNLASIAKIAGEVYGMGASRGGVAAGRRGYEDGGAPDDTLPEQTVEAQRPDPKITYTSGLNPVDRPSVEVKTPDKVDTGVAAGSDTGSKDHWWKHAENIVPLVSGLAAMGTAPTRSWGTALAAGLGAGAASYVPTQQGLAYTGETQAMTGRIGSETRGQDIRNQTSQLGLDVARESLKPTAQATSPITSVASPVPTDPSKLTAYYQKKYAVPPMTPEEATGVEHAQLAAGFLKNPGLEQQAQTKVQNRIDNAKFQNQRAAQAEHDQLYQQAVVLPPGQARDALEAHINAIHPLTGDEYVDKAGRTINSRTGAPPVGIATQTLTPEQKSARQLELARPVQTGAAAPAPLSQYMANPNAGQGQPPPASAPSGSQNNFNDAPGKPSWLADPHHVVTDAEKPIATGYAEKELALRNEANQLPQTQRELIKTQRILSLLPNAKTGPGTDTMAAIQTSLGNMTGSQFTSWLDSNPSAHALLQKQLGTKALETTLDDLRSRGAQVRLGQQESKLIIGTLSASTEMPKAAIQSLLQWQLQDAKYEAQRQSAIPEYLSQGKDAQSFDNYYATKNPLKNSLTTTAPAGTSVTKMMPNGERLQAYAATHFGGDVAKATQFLTAQGYK